MNTEIEFEDLIGFEGLYKINKLGDIWSCYFNKIMIPHISEDGYQKINFKKEAHTYKRSIHRLLAIQYIENSNPEEYNEVDHIDRNKLNNELTNLRWCSRTMNANNKSNCLSNLNEEELKQREIELREYKRKWAETNRRENGIMLKTKMSEEEVREKNRIYMQNKRANMTSEEREKYLEKQRSYAKPLSEEKRLEAIERTRLWRETKMTEEQKQAKNEKAKIRQANIRANLTEEEKVIRNEEAKTRMATKYANMTQEEKDEINRKRRENRKPLTEEQKQKQREVSLRHYHKNK